MKVIIAGSQAIKIYSVVKNSIEKSGFGISEVVSGTAWGVDKKGELWAARNNVPIKRFPADWRTHGKSAGFIRNAEMAEYADALIAVWDGKSKGTWDMICKMNELWKPVFIDLILE